MEQDEATDSTIPIVFIRDSKDTAIAAADLGRVRAYDDENDKQGIENVITFLTQSHQTE